MVFKILGRLKRDKLFLLFSFVLIFLYFICRYVENILNLTVRIFSFETSCSTFDKITHIYDIRFHFLILFFVFIILYLAYAFNKSYSKRNPSKTLNWLLCICTVILAGTILDLTLELTELNKGSLGLRESKDPNLKTELIPNFRSIYSAYGKHTSVEINSKGFRDKEYSIQKSEGVYRILCLGDSYTFGLGLELGETYPKLLEKKLNQNKKFFEVLNFGIPGYNTKQELNLLKKVGLIYNPDLIILGVVNNDVVDYDKIYLEGSFKKCVRDFLIKHPRRISKLIFETLETYELERHYHKTGSRLDLSLLKDIVYETKGRNIDLIILLYEDTQTEELTNFAKEFNITFVEMQKVYLMKNIKKEETIIATDDPHPSKFSNEIIAEELYKILSEDEKFE